MEAVKGGGGGRRSSNAARKIEYINF